MGNKENYISDELLAAFLDGNTNEEETMRVLKAMKNDKALQEALRVAISVDEGQGDMDFLPMLRMAAENGENICCVLCEAKILQRRGIDIEIDSLLASARSHNWLKPKGTPLYSIGRLLESSALMVTRQYNATIKDIQEALELDNDVIVVVDDDKLYPGQIDYEDLPNHAIVVLGMDILSGTVTIYDPQGNTQFSSWPTDTITTVGMDEFELAWHESNNYMVRVLQSINEYKPHPISLDDISLTEDLTELREAIAENTHDIWAEARMAEGWTYGTVRDDDKKQHPNLVPYSALPESDKEYERIMAWNTIKLVKKLGFKITKEE